MCVYCILYDMSNELYLPSWISECVLTLLVVSMVISVIWATIYHSSLAHRKRTDFIVIFLWIYI
jgi:hypothetical protein